MILVRMVFQTKWGKAQEVVDSMKEMAEKGSDAMRGVVGSNVRYRLLTDLSGPFHTVVQEMEVESLGAWQRIRATMFSDPEFQVRQPVGSRPSKADAPSSIPSRRPSKRRRSRRWWYR